MQIILKASGRDVVLHIDVRYDYRYHWGGRIGVEKNYLVLNTFKDGRWGQEAHPSGFKFTPGLTTTVTVEAQPGCFLIKSNGQEVTCFIYRSGLAVNTVREIVVKFVDNAGDAQTPKATIKGRVRSLTINLG